MAGPSSSGTRRARSKISSKSGPRRSPDVSRSFMRVVMATPQPLAVGDTHVGEVHLVEVRGARNLLDAPGLDARRLHREEEECEPLVLRRLRVAAGDEDRPVRPVRARRPDLLAVDYPVIAV